MKLPAYILSEINRRLDQDLPRRKFDPILEALNLTLVEPEPAPDFDQLAASLEDDCIIGTFTVPAELKLGDNAAVVYLRVSYAIPTEKDFLGQLHGPQAQLDILAWDDGEPERPSWRPIGMSILSDQMADDIWGDIAWDAEVQERKGSEH